MIKPKAGLFRTKTGVKMKKEEFQHKVNNIAQRISESLSKDFEKALEKAEVEGNEPVPESFCWRLKQSTKEKSLIFVEVICLLDDVGIDENTSISSITPAFDRNYLEENPKW